jgi:flagellar hook-length control protein FliK
MAARSGVHEIRLQIRPESFGEVKINIRVQGDVVFAKISVESQQIKHIVESNMQLLKDSLSQQHLQAGSLDVNVGHQGTPDPEGDREIYNAGGLPQFSGDGEGSEAVEDTTVAMMATGDETGRRFGDNTVEYFA